MSEHTITGLLNDLRAGREGAADHVLPLIYNDLRRIARAKMAGLMPGSSLQPSELVHEAWLRIVGKAHDDWENRRHFFFVAARAMRDILVEQARAKAALKRGGDRHRVELGSMDLAIATPAEDMLALDEALEQLEKQDPLKRQLVELRFFAGLTMSEAAKALGLALRTAEGEWRCARAILHRQLSKGDAPSKGG